MNERMTLFYHTTSSEPGKGLFINVCVTNFLASAAGVSVINGEGKKQQGGRREKKGNASRHSAVKREKFFELVASGGR